MEEESFFSINRLVEFGMGVAIAQQMVKTMNESMTTMHIPGAMNPLQVPAPRFYYVVINGLQAGPFTDQDLAQLIAEQKIDKSTYIWKPGMSNWEIAERLPEILKIVALTPPPLPKNL
jgi:hypothetical protein